MINISTDRNKYILTATVPSGTTDIQYNVSVEGNLVFQGKTKYFGGAYSVDVSDWLEAYLTSRTTDVTSVTVSVVFKYFVSGGVSQQVMSCTWTPEIINVGSGTAASNIYLTLTNSGFLRTGNNTLTIPLSVKNGILEGKTTNKLEKIGYTDRYGNNHNGSMTNHYELECYIDPCWRPDVKTRQDVEYEKIMLAIQNSKKTVLQSTGTVRISGMTYSGYGYYMDVHVKDVEKVETYSSYSGDHKVPTYKITLEVFR